jgi:zinc transporter ZupT
MTSPISILVAIVVYTATLGFPVANILRRAGFSRWWALLGFFPVFAVIGLWMFAFAKWPREEARLGEERKVSALAV